jgi:putative aldouronate transport system permease protein
VVLTFCFAYIPIYGVQIAFKNFSPARGIWGSPWVGFDQFLRFFRTNQFKIVITNTFVLSIYGIAVGFPLPIILALMINSLRSAQFKRILQTITYMPYFISTVVWSGIWQGIGWGSIIYLAALSSVDSALYEAATIDGANKWQKIIHIDLPSIAPTCIILLILSAGGILNVGFEKAFLMQNPLNLSRSEVINTYIYKVGIQSTQYSFSTAVGLFNNVINFAILAAVNWVSSKLSETSLW